MNKHFDHICCVLILRRTSIKLVVYYSLFCVSFASVGGGRRWDAVPLHWSLTRYAFSQFIDVHQPM
jgi:uncharacterized MAPEG superfamily protein